MYSNIFRLKNNKWHLFLGAILLLCPLVVSVAYADIGDRLEVFESKAVLYAGPSSSASRLVNLQAGEQMVEMERQGRWVFVALKNTGAQGWVKSSVVHKAPLKMVRVQKKKIQKKRKLVSKKSRRRKTRKVKVKAVSKSNIEIKDVPEESVSMPETPYVTKRVSLAGMGYKKGVLFEGAATIHGTTLFFPAPMDSHITNGTLKLLFRASPNLNSIANLRVSVNDDYYQQVSLPSDMAMHELKILLPSSVFKGGVVKVDVRAAMPVSDDRCLDERLSDVFLHILPQSSLSLSYQPVAVSIRDAWSMLPEHVTLSLSKGSLSKAQFASTLAIMSMLMDKGKTVEITRLPKIGDIVVASKQDVNNLISQGVSKGTNSSFGEGGNLSLVRFQKRSAIAVTEPYDVQPMYLLDKNWSMLASGDQYRVFQPDSLNAHSGLSAVGDKDNKFYSIPLTKLGLNTDTKFLSREVSWHTMINPYSLPLGMKADFLNLNIVAPVRWKDDPSYELYVFLNDVLVKSSRLENNGLKQKITVDLPSEYQKQFNDIRVVVQHDVVTGNCQGVQPFDYVQIMPDSALVVKKALGDAPKQFSDLASYLQAGFDAYIDNDFLNSPEQALYLMARLAADLPLVIEQNKLHFINKGSALNPKGPFVAVGRFALGDGVDAPLRFDQGHVKIESPNGKSYFDVNDLPKVAVAEIAQASSSYGLWVIPSHDVNQAIAERLDLSSDDVAFIDTHGVIKTLNSSEPSIVQVYYPDAKNWFDVLGKYRFWFIVLLWFMLTMIVVYLYRMSRKNKLEREEDDSHYARNEVPVSSDSEDHGLDHLRERR